MTDQEIISTEASLLDESVVLSDQARGRSALGARLGSSALAVVPQKTQVQLLRMFADSSLLEKHERADLVRELRECVKSHPQVSDLRVLFGMALCVNFEVQDAIEELRVGVQLAPDSFIAQLKMGELWMRLRVMDKAEEHTHRAALLAGNRVQAELARKQGASIRAMKFAGIERGGGYKSPWTLVTRVVQRFRRRESSEAIVPADVS